MDLVELHRRAVQGWQRRVEGVPPTAWVSPTPCADWDVRALVNHVVAEQLWTRPLVLGRTVEEVGDIFDGDVLGADPIATSRVAAEDATEVLAARLPFGGEVHLSFGPTPVEEYAWQLTADHLVHAWDLAAATGQDRTLDADLVAEVASWFAEREDLYRSAGAVGPRARTQGASGTDPQSRLLTAFGRDPAWAADHVEV